MSIGYVLNTLGCGPMIGKRGVISQRRKFHGTIYKVGHAILVRIIIIASPLGYLDIILHILYNTSNAIGMFMYRKGTRTHLFDSVMHFGPASREYK
jgi:hypothetical protein